VPEALLEEYARGRTAIADAPHGETTLEFQDWTPERVRTHEADLRKQNFRHRVVVAVHEATGRVAALTELGNRAGHPSRVFQLETSVGAEFRGRGLGLAVKGAMLRWLTAEQPEVDQIFTQTATGNVPMSRINHALGYVTTNVTVVLESGAAELLERVEA
jgi:RimJ/RimL family protein N-acetyltransferase